MHTNLKYSCAFVVRTTSLQLYFLDTYDIKLHKLRHPSRIDEKHRRIYSRFTSVSLTVDIENTDGLCYSFIYGNTNITCSTVVLQCYRRQAIPMEQAKIRPSVTLYSLDRSLSNLVWLITSATPTRIPIFVEFGWVGNSPRIREI